MAGDVFGGVFCAVFFPARCLGWDLVLNWVSFWGFCYLLMFIGGNYEGLSSHRCWKCVFNNFPYLFDCTTVGHASDWMTVPSLTTFRVTWTVGDRHPYRVVFGQAYRGLTGGVALLLIFSVAISASLHVCFILDLKVGRKVCFLCF